MKSEIFELFKDKLTPELRDIDIVKRQLINILNISPHRATKMLKDATIVNNVELVTIAKRLGIPCWILIKNHGVGRNGVEQVIKDHHKTVWEEITQNVAA